MHYTDTLVNRYDDQAFQTAFRRYFDELGVKVTNWDGLFAEMSQSGSDYAWVRREESGMVVGFIQFTVMEMNSWFFSARCGFLREFWIAPELRRQGHGGQLLQMAEDWLWAQSCAYVLLTTDTTPDFYRKHGYILQRGIQAKNRDDVYVKTLT